MISIAVLSIFIITGLSCVLLNNKLFSNLNNQEISVPTSTSTNTQISTSENSAKLLCPLIDGRANIIDTNKTYYQKDLIPLESRITASFRFSKDSVLFLKYFPGSSNFISSKGYDNIAGAQVLHIIVPDKKNVNFFIDKLSLPQIFNPFPANYFGEGKIPPPLYSDFLGMFLTVGINNKFYFLSGASCAYGSGICFQKLISMDSEGHNPEEIKIPSEYAPEIRSWSGGQERGISNVNTFLEEIAGVDSSKIIFKTSDMHKSKTVKYVILDTSDNSWSESETFKGEPLKYPYDVLKTNRCISYATSLGTYVVKLEKGIAMSFPAVGKSLEDVHMIDKETIGLYFVKN